MQGQSSDNLPLVMIKKDRNLFALNGDIMDIAERATQDFIPAAKDDNKVRHMVQAWNAADQQSFTASTTWRPAPRVSR